MLFRVSLRSVALNASLGVHVALEPWLISLFILSSGQSHICRYLGLCPFHIMFCF